MTTRALTALYQVLKGILGLEITIFTSHPFWKNQHLADGQEQFGSGGAAEETSPECQLHTQ